MTYSSGVGLLERRANGRSVCCGTPIEEDEFGAPSWSPWADAGVPMSAVDERLFVTQLRALAEGEPCAFRRMDASVLVNALRTGIMPGPLQARLPGIRPANLLGAYVELSSRRAKSVEAWQTIVAERSRDAVLECGVRASRLLPGAVSQLERVLAQRPATLNDTIERMMARVDAARRLADDLESRVERCERGCTRGAFYAARLYDPELPSAWSDPFYVPQRVTDLVPERLRALTDGHELAD
jgi:hypothetical protein